MSSRWISIGYLCCTIEKNVTEEVGLLLESTESTQENLEVSLHYWVANPVEYLMNFGVQTTNQGGVLSRNISVSVSRGVQRKQDFLASAGAEA